MLHAADQAYLRTRLNIFHADMLGETGITQLMNATASELSERFGINLQDDSQNLNEHLCQFERGLMQSWLDQISALLRPIHGPARDILVQWTKRYELLNLKAIIRGKLRGLAYAEIKQSLFRLPGFLALDHEKLLNTDDIPEMLRRLENTPYYSFARQTQKRFAENQDPFLLDASLDQHFYSQFMTHLNKLESNDKNAMRLLVGKVIDLHNLVWMMRYRYNYRLPPAQAMYLAIDGGHHLKREHLHELVAAPDLENMLPLLPTHYQTLLSGYDSIMQIEMCLENDLCNEAEKAFRHSRSVLTSAFAYLVLRFYELKKIQAIVQAKLRGLSDELLRYAIELTPETH